MQQNRMRAAIINTTTTTTTPITIFAHDARPSPCWSFGSVSDLLLVGVAIAKLAVTLVDDEVGVVDAISVLAVLVVFVVDGPNCPLRYC